MRQDSIALANATVISAEEQAVIAQKQDSLRREQERIAMGGFAEKLYGTETYDTITTDLAVYTFSNKGGKLVSVELKDYQRLNPQNNGQPVVLFDAKDTEFGYVFYAPNRVATNDLYFEVHSKTDSQITYRLYADSTNFTQFTYLLAQDNYMLDFVADFGNMSALMGGRNNTLALDWSVVSPQEEKGFDNENNYTTIAYKFPGTDQSTDDIGVSKERKSEIIDQPVQWVAFKQQFFSSILVADSRSFERADLGYATFAPGSGNIKNFRAQLSVPYTAGLEDTYNYKMYLGPNNYTIMEEYGAEYSFEKLVPLGWGIFGWVNKFIVIPVFNLLSKHIASYGLIILLLTLIIKLLIFPLTYKSYLSTAKMRLLAPELKVIAERYPKREDAMKKQQATMALYKSAGVSPLGGCIPMLIQMPILFALFRFFPSSIELRGQGFWWATDLSSYDSILELPFNIPFYGDHISLWTLLMAASLFALQKINMSQQSAMQNQQMPGMKFMMLYMMPVMLLFIFNNYSSGLSYYYFLSNVITIGQTFLIRNFVSDDSLHARMQENAKKPVKKSKFQERLEEMQRQQTLRK